jgi:osmotically-inducible protein OsmY
MAFPLRTSIRGPALCMCAVAGLAGCAAILQHRPLESPADAKLSAEVSAVLEQNPALGAPNLISVQARGGVVYLRGLVATPYQIEEAGSLAARLPGAKHVANLLSIDNAR